MSEELESSEKLGELNPETEFSEKLLAVYSNSELLKMKANQEERGEEFSALFTDIDNTFHRKDRQQESEALFAKAKEGEYPVVAVTGNHFQGVMKRIESGELPKFPVIIGAVGTEIWVLQENGEYAQDLNYQEMLIKEKHFDRPALAQNAAKMIKDFKTEFPQAELDYQGTIESPHRLAEIAYLQNPDDTSIDVQPFKISFHFFAESEAELEKISKAANERFPEQQLVISEEINFNNQLPPEATRKKYCLDILPITKAGAVEYVSKLTGVKKGMVAGDSGNDVDMLLKTEKLQAVLVGGAKTEALKAGNEAIEPKQANTSFRWIRDDQGRRKAVYFEKGGRLGPESIEHAARILKKAEGIKKAREEEEKVSKT
ncbi:MAG: HAD family hydrolase [Patescibacteria group bacterium]|jgi:hydroxymethylpyrimidine pyrophosphatase-like HAD family hydrolase